MAQIKHNGKTQSLLAWSKELGITYGTIRNRFKKGLPIKEILNIGSNRHKLDDITYNDETKSLKEWANVLHVSYSTLWKRHKQGLTGDELFIQNQPAVKKGRIVEFNGVSQNLASWGRQLGISREAVRQRVFKGIPLE